MSDFNYEKAWYIFAKPAIENLNNKQRDVFSRVRAIIGGLNQGKDLNIPLTPAIIATLEELTTKELAELSRASYFYGHWKPGKVESLFNNKSGESWKVTNAIDQILRKRLKPLPHNILIHDGMFRVTFSSKDCWMFEEFGLATKENLDKFINCDLSFMRDSFNANAKILIDLTGDLWDTANIDKLPNNEDYNSFLELKKQWNHEANEKRKQDKLNSIKKDIENSETEYKAFKWLIDHNIDYENCIYYSHTGKFRFGWRNKLTQEEKDNLKTLLVGFPYPVEYK